MDLNRTGTLVSYQLQDDELSSMYNKYRLSD